MEAGGRRLSAVLENVTHGGLGLACSFPPPPDGTRVTVSVLMEGTAVELPGEISWFWSDGERWRLGIHLDAHAANPFSLRIFRRWLASLENHSSS